MISTIEDLTYHRFSGDNLRLSWDEYYVKYWETIDSSVLKEIQSGLKVDLERILSDYNTFKYSLKFAYSHIKSLQKTRVLSEFYKQFPFTDKELMDLYSLPDDFHYFFGLNSNVHINLDLFLSNFKSGLHYYELINNPNLTEKLIYKYWDIIMKGEHTQRLFLTTYNFSLNFLREHLTKFNIFDKIECILRNDRVSEEVTDFFKVVHELGK